MLREIATPFDHPFTFDLSTDCIGFDPARFVTMIGRELPIAANRKRRWTSKMLSTYTAFDLTIGRKPHSFFIHQFLSLT